MRLLSRDEIAAGIRNALERGQSVDQAVQSFINAGYNPNEVEEAARLFNQGGSSFTSSSSSPVYASSSIIQSNSDSNTTAQNLNTSNIQGQSTNSGSSDFSPRQLTPVEPPSMQAMSSSQTTMYSGIRSKAKSHTPLIILLVFLLILIIAGIVSAIIYKDSIADFLSSAFS